MQTTASSQLIKLQMKNKSETQVRVVDNKRLKCKQLFRQVYKNVASGIKCKQLLLSSNAKHQNPTGIKLKDWVRIPVEDSCCVSNNKTISKM